MKLLRNFSYINYFIFKKTWIAKVFLYKYYKLYKNKNTQNFENNYTFLNYLYFLKDEWLFLFSGLIQYIVWINYTTFIRLKRQKKMIPWWIYLYIIEFYKKLMIFDINQEYNCMIMNRIVCK